MFTAHFGLHRLFPLALVLLALLGAASSSLAQTTVYSQPAVFPTTTGFSAWTSSSSTAFVTSDNFTLAHAASLSGISWQGFTFDGNGGVQGVEPTTFNIEFRADSAGIPGAVLENEVVTPDKTLAGTINFFNGPGTNSIYDYTASLSSVFDVSAGTPLWVSVIGDTSGNNFWTWTQGTGGDNSCYQEVTANVGAVSRFQSGDRAFSLTSSPVPEASATVSFGLLLAFGLSGLVIAKRKKALAAV